MLLGKVSPWEATWKGVCLPGVESRTDLAFSQAHDVESSPAFQVGVAESTSVAVGFAIRATVGHIFQGADRRDFFEILAKGSCNILFTESVLSLAKVGPMLHVVGTQGALAGVGDAVGAAHGVVDHGAGHQLPAILQRGPGVLAAVQLGSFFYAPSIVLLGNLGSVFHVMGTQGTVIAVGDTVCPADLAQDEGTGSDGLAGFGTAQVRAAVNRSTFCLASSIMAFLNISPMLYVVGTDAAVVVISEPICATHWEQDPGAADQVFATLHLSGREFTAIELGSLLSALSTVPFANMGPLFHVVGTDRALVVVCVAICATNWIQVPWTGYQCFAIFSGLCSVPGAVNSDRFLAGPLMHFGNIGVMVCIVGTDPTVVVISEAI